MIALKNVSPQPFVVSLYCEHYCKKGAACGGTRRQVAQQVKLPTGESGVRMTEKCSPPALRVDPKQVVGDLHEAVLNVPQVQQAIASGLLVMLRTPAAAPPPVQQDTVLVDCEPAPEDAVPVDSGTVSDVGEPRSRSKGKKASTPSRR